MTHVQRALLAIVTVALFASSMPLAAQTAFEGADQISDASLSYMFRAENLGFPSESVIARFEYRSGEQVLGSDTTLLSFKGADSLLVPIPRTTWAKSSDGGELRYLVFADDLMLAEFDEQSLRAYNRTLDYTQRPADKPALKIFCESPCDGGCGPFDDYDCDGVNNITDNCTDDANSNQADCDNDGYGDVCDVVDGTFQASGAVKTCMTDKDSHLPPIYKSFEHHVEQRLVDVSSCGSPDRWNRWIRDEAYCFNLGDQFCCEGLSTSIQAVGDSVSSWCGGSKRNIDFCN